MPIGVGSDRKRPGTGQGPEEHGIGLSAVLAREGERVEGDQLAREGAGRGVEALDRIDPAARRDLLVDREETMRARDDRRARRRREPELDRAPHLQELGGQEHVERSRHRVKGEDRRRVVSRCAAFGGELDVVGRRSGALGDTRDRGAVDRIAVGDGRVHDPLVEHAPALAADGGYQETQEPRVGHVVTAASRRMTACRTRLTSRVHRVGFLITLTS